MTGLSHEDPVLYVYDDDKGWGDLLTTYNEQSFTYDEIGNLVSDGTWTYTWEHGRELASMTDGTTTWSYTYNADGIRTKRTDGTTTYYYAYNGGNLRMMQVDGVNWYFVYDATGPMIMGNPSVMYYYVRNLQGDVIAILNDSGTPVVEYEYDAWGNILSITGSLADTLGQINPLRYRGYVYDSETGLYYLQSRYYDPEMGRFINADALVATGQGPLGNNMFAYCGNNPIIYFDPDGAISKVCFSDDIDVGLAMPWKDVGRAGGRNFLSIQRNSTSKKRIDITDRLNDAMFKHAEELSSYLEIFGGLAAAFYFADMVRSGGEWDLKSQKEWGLHPSLTYVYNGKELAYDDVGNIHYGFVGRVLFTEGVLLLAGGLVQIISGTSSFAYANSNFDDPRDQIAISFGYSLWEVD